MSHEMEKECEERDLRMGDGSWKRKIDSLSSLAIASRSFGDAKIGCFEMSFLWRREEVPKGSTTGSNSE